MDTCGYMWIHGFICGYMGIYIYIYTYLFVFLLFSLKYGLLRSYVGERHTYEQLLFLSGLAAGGCHIGLYIGYM